jgi:hypothetical protein
VQTLRGGSLLGFTFGLDHFVPIKCWEREVQLTDWTDEAEIFFFSIQSIQCHDWVMHYKRVPKNCPQWGHTGYQTTQIFTYDTKLQFPFIKCTRKSYYRKKCLKNNAFLELFEEQLFKKNLRVTESSRNVVKCSDVTNYQNLNWYYPFYLRQMPLTHSSPSGHFRPGKIAEFLVLSNHVP